MEQIITVARIQPPAPGKKQAAIYDQSDQRWGVFPDDLNGFVVGGTYRIWDWQSNMFNGRQYKTIKSGNYEYQGMGGVLPPQSNANTSAAPRSGGPAPRPSAPSGGFDDVTRRRDIFVCGALNNTMANPNVNPLDLQGKDLVALVWKLRKTFDYALGPGAQDPNITTARVGPDATPKEQAEAALGYGRVDGEPIPQNSGRRQMDDEIPF